MSHTELLSATMGCTLKKRGSIFVLTLTCESDEQHRLKPTLLSSLLAALTQVNSQAIDVLMRDDRDVLYMPEVDLDIMLPDYFAAVMREKVTTTRDLVLAGRKMTAEEAVEIGIVRSAHDSPEGTVEAMMGLGEELAGRKWVKEAYVELRKSLFPEVCDVLGLAPKYIVSKI